MNKKTEGTLLYVSGLVGGLLIEKIGAKTVIGKAIANGAGLTTHSAAGVITPQIYGMAKAVAVFVLANPVVIVAAGALVLGVASMAGAEESDIYTYDDESGYNVSPRYEFYL